MPDSPSSETLPDLTLAECCQRWGVSSRNAIKARAAALGVELRRESSTRTVWPAEHMALGDELAEHLKKPGATLGNFRKSTFKDTSNQSADIRNGCLACLVIAVTFFLFGSCTVAYFSSNNKIRVRPKTDSPPAFVSPPQSSPVLVTPSQPSESAFTPGVEGRGPDEVCNSTSEACRKWTEMAQMCEANMAARESGYMGELQPYCSNMESFREKVTGILDSSSPGAYDF
jgi:hypothetical protein